MGDKKRNAPQPGKRKDDARYRSRDEEQQSGVAIAEYFAKSGKQGCLPWTLENLVDGNVVNQIKVPAREAEFARIALKRMLEVV